ncbi:amidophosphoribosyltransferase [Solirubrobacter phytolaccae]|uniref:Amidophosphoribosyltransferase n=1 Tax=Solirubrobacter phytolaccae TaxID=1404360 RepID=A0A9X3N751_9ACTN|nr:amidophosphoribosyltransferase [Solirubrobacter phytolaccae]MDA0179700.1 amidophosphoribosyltransferase [Solirubrobacter phytolaccae]
MLPSESFLDDRDGPRDECGVFGIVAPGREVSRLTYFALYALQHRGQESAGIATSQGGHIMAMRDQGLVNQVFDESKLRALQGDMALGHVRYSTTGANSWENTQPVWRSDKREVALAHNGNLVNVVELHTELRQAGVTFRSTSDSEIIAALLSTHEAETIEDAVVDVIQRVEGAYSTVVMTKDRVVAFRDPLGLRPLSLGMIGDSYAVASESCAFDIIGAKFLRDVQPGEVVSITPKGIQTRQAVESPRAALCVFEHIYFARPDSRLGGRVIQVSRGRMGEILARESPVEADLVIPVPDSGGPAARGFARASGLPQDDGLIKNRYVARTFIQPGQELRKHGLRLKFNPLPEVVSGKRIVVVDDSIVRGNTTRQIVQMLRDAGASEVHMRISAPPIKHPCHYGIDMSTREEMIAHNRTEAEVAAELGADSLAYLSLEGVYEAIGSAREVHCDACFSGEYPLVGTSDKNAFENALPLVRS